MGLEDLEYGIKQPNWGPFEGHTGGALSVAFSYDGRRIVSASRDETVRIWSVETHQQIGNTLHRREPVPRMTRDGKGRRIMAICHVSESADGLHIVSRDRHGCTIIWRRESGKIVWLSTSAESNSEETDSGESDSGVGDSGGNDSEENNCGEKKLRRR